MTSTAGTRAGDGADQALRDHGLERGGQLAQHAGANLLGEEGQDAVERVVAVVGMQRGQAQVAGLGIGQCGRHGLAVADFADQNHIGCLAQRVLECGCRVLVSVPTSRWLTMDFLLRNWYSMGLPP
jgi:hypothetical protein